MTPVEAAAVAAIRAHAEKHVKSGRATYSTPAIQLLLRLLDELMKLYAEAERDQIEANRQKLFELAVFHQERAEKAEAALAEAQRYIEQLELLIKQHTGAQKEPA